MSLQELLKTLRGDMRQKKHVSVEGGASSSSIDGKTSLKHLYCFQCEISSSLLAEVLSC